MLANEKASSNNNKPRVVNVNVPDKSDIEKTLSFLSLARIAAHNLIAEATVAYEDLGDLGGKSRVNRQAGKLMAQLALMSEFCNDLLQTVEALETRGRGRSSLEALLERRAELEELITQKQKAATAL